MAAPFTAAIVGSGKIVNAAEDAGHARGVLHILVVRPAQQGLQFVEVKTRAKSLARARQYDDLGQRCRPLNFVKRRQQFVHQRVADGVAFLRPVERDGGDAGIVRELNGFKFHVGVSRQLNRPPQTRCIGRRIPL